MKRAASAVLDSFDVNAVIPTLVLGFFTLMGLLLPTQLAGMQWPILLFSMLCLGFPHGACDVLALRNATSNSGSGATAALITRFCWLYLALGVATFAIWLLSPVLGLISFLALTVWHWGEGDTWNVFPQGQVRSVAAIGRGLVVLSAPLVLQFEASRDVLHGFTALGNQKNALDGLWGSAPLFLGLGLVLQFAGGALQWRGTQKPEQRSLVWWIVGETALILGFWSAVPPLVGVAVYLCGVHALRHLLRLEAARSRFAPPYRSLLVALGQWHGGALGATIGALVLLAPLLLFWPQLFRGAPDVSVGYFLLIAALTTPHAATVGFLVGRRQL